MGLSDNSSVNMARREVRIALHLVTFFWAKVARDRNF